MARVFIPAQWRDLTGGMSQLEVDGALLGQVVDRLEARFPGVRARLLDDEGDVVGSLAVSIDGGITSRGLMAPVGPQSEIHFLPAIGGG